MGDSRTVLRELPAGSVNCCVTSPPYWGLRDYGCDGQMGLEATPEEFVAGMVELFSSVRGAMTDDGTLWLNLGDTYNAYNGNRGATHGANKGHLDIMPRLPQGAGLTAPQLKQKDLVGIPWRVALALQQPYINWQVKSEAMRAWVAGIVDGEGCITILQTKSSHSESLSFPPIVQVRMSDREALDRLVKVVGSKVGKAQHPPSQVAARQRKSWQWKVVSDRAANLIAEIYPYLTVKRKQAIVAWNHQQFRQQRGNQERTADDLKKEQYCKTLINQLNQRQLVDLPSWMKEPTVEFTPGWYLRQDLIWHKPNPMPESVTDRCTKSHEYIFLLSKSPRYYFNQEAILEPVAASTIERLSQPSIEEQVGSDRVPGKTNGTMKAVSRSGNKARKPASARGVPVDTGGQTNGAVAGSVPWEGSERNKRSVWTVTTKPYKGAHFATFPPDLIQPCILAGCPSGGVVLDPFLGSGTTAIVARKNGCKSIGIELNPEYAKLAAKRLRQGSLQFTEDE